MRIGLICKKRDINTSNKLELFGISINSTFAIISLEENIGFI